MSAVSLGLKILKIGLFQFIKNDLIKEIAGEFTDVGIDKIESFCEKYTAEINHLLAVEDEEMERQNIPQEKRTYIRENIKDFILNLELDEMARECQYDEEAFGEALADKYKNLYEQDMEDDFTYYQRMLYSLANYAMQTIKSSESFEKERILDCYKLLLVITEQRAQDRAWQSSVTNSLKELLNKSDTAQAPQIGIPHIITNAPAQVDSNTFMKEKDVEDIYEKIKEAKNILLVNGFGGVGKTSVAKALFHKVKDEYDHIGWIEYNGSL